MHRSSPADLVSIIAQLDPRKPTVAPEPPARHPPASFQDMLREHGTHCQSETLRLNLRGTPDGECSLHIHPCTTRFQLFLTTATRDPSTSYAIHAAVKMGLFLQTDVCRTAATKTPHAARTSHPATTQQRIH